MRSSVASGEPAHSGFGWLMASSCGQRAAKKRGRHNQRKLPGMFPHDTRNGNENLVRSLQTFGLATGSTSSVTVSS